MDIFLVGADLEENLGLGMLAAVARGQGHRVAIRAFDDAGQSQRIATEAVQRRPGLVGVSMQFQHRAADFLGLGAMLRRAGYRGHLTCGGQFATAAWERVLSARSPFDSVVLHEGEQTFPELVGALEAGRHLQDVAGLALRLDDGAVVRTAPRPLCDDLDAYPFPERYRSHTRHLTVPFIPVLGSRGCWGRCAYCSITTAQRAAREAGGRGLRLRSPASVADEMASLARAAGGEAIFCFHDDNFLLPRPEDTLRRVTELRLELDRRGVGFVGIIGKCRPDTLTLPLARELERLGVIRLYVGIENGSEAGARHLDRRTRTEELHRALDVLGEADIFGCYNLLIFEPQTTLEDLRDNVAFMRRHADHPVNFCRAEPYEGTPLTVQLADRQRLRGSYLGRDYTLDDDQAELAFRMSAAVFRERNFGEDGVANRAMGLGYGAKVIEKFRRGSATGADRFKRRARELTREVVLDSAKRLEHVVDLVDHRGRGEHATELLVRETVALGLAVAESDRELHARIDTLLQDMNDHARAQQEPPRTRSPLWYALGGAALAAVSSIGCGGTTNAVDPAPQDSGVRDTGVRDTGVRDTGAPPWVVDCVPQDSGRRDTGWGTVDPVPWDSGVRPDVRPDITIVDPPPPDTGRLDGSRDASDAADGGDARPDVWMVDPLPFDSPRSAMGGAFQELTPRRAPRPPHLPLHDPPQPRLRTVDTRADGTVEVVVEDLPAAASLRWEARGEVTGEGDRVRWRPEDPSDQLNLAVRTHGGIAVVSLRAKRT